MKSSWRWGPPVGGCKSFCKVLQTGMTNWADFFAQKNLPNISFYVTIIFWPISISFGCKNCHFLKAFFICSFWGAVTALLLVAPQNEQLLLLPSYWSLPKMNSAPQTEKLLFLPSFWSLPKISAPQNEHVKKALRKWQFSDPKCEQNWPNKFLWLDRYVGKGFWAKKSAQLVIPVRSTFQNDLHPPIGGPNRQLDSIELGN